MIKEKARIEKITRILRDSYPRPKTDLKYKTPFQLLVATILSAQCTDERVNKITPLLFAKYPTIKDFAKANRGKLEKEIHSTGFYKNKAKSIIGASKIILENFRGKLPDNMKDLITLPGVARKTANVVLSSAFKEAEGIAVDTHVKRLSQRLGFSKEETAERIEKDLMHIIPGKDWLDISYLLINHGRKVCQARRPLCPECSIKHLCPSAGKFFKNYHSKLKI